MTRLTKPLPRAAAFTMMETIAVLIVIGILSAVVLPFFSQSSEFNARTSRDELLATLRYAQQLAMADSSLTVQFVSTSSGYSVSVNGSAISLPEGGGSYPRTLASNLNLSPATTLSYSVLGDTTATTFTLTATEKVCVAATGFAYAC